MSADQQHTGRRTSRNRVRVSALPVSLLPIGGIIILLGLIFNILRLIIIG